VILNDSGYNPNIARGGESRALMNSARWIYVLIRLTPVRILLMLPNMIINCSHKGGWPQINRKLWYFNWLYDAGLRRLPAIWITLTVLERANNCKRTMTYFQTLGEWGTPPPRFLPLNCWICEKLHGQVTTALLFRASLFCGYWWRLLRKFSALASWTQHDALRRKIAILAYGTQKNSSQTFHRP